MKKEREYKEHYVAFLDILGFKELLKENSCDSVFSIFSTLRENTHSQMTLNGAKIEAYEYIKHTILSDSIVVYIESDIDDAFSTLIDVCKKLQMALASRETPILIRGGIAKGNLFWDEGIIYGSGLVKAYLMESNLAKYPRIVFSGETLEDGRKNAKYTFPELEGILKKYKTDDDRLNYVDYLDICYYNLSDGVRYYDGLKKLCNAYLNKEIDHSLREKYLWLQKKIEYAIEHHSNYKEYYRKLEEEECEQWAKEYAEKFEIFPTNLIAKIKVAKDDEKEQK